MPGPILPVILCGGGGTRLAPLSTPECPKQFLELFQNNPHSLFERTLSRLSAAPDILPPLIIGNIQHYELIRDQIGGAAASVILEPVARNTAPAVAIAAHWARLHVPEATLVVMPSDHVIGDLATFQIDLINARRIANDGYIAVFGVKPDWLETGYGYIEPGAEIEANGASAHYVEAFVEKPDLATAQRYLDDQTKYWNSGIFVFSATTMLAEFERYAPEIVNRSAAALQEAEARNPALVLALSEYEMLDPISLDYAIMEKTSVAALVRFSSHWRDLGSIEALRVFSSSTSATTDPVSLKVQTFLDGNG